MTGPALDWQDILNLTHPEAAPLLFPRAATDATSVAGQALPQPAPDQSTIGPYSPLRNAGRAALAGLKGAFTNSPPALAAQMLAQPARDLLNDRPGLAAINALLLPAAFAMPEGEGLAKAVLEHSGGATLDPVTLRPTTGSGYAVADPKFTRTFDNPGDMQAWFASPEVQTRLKQPGAHIGVWKNEVNISDFLPSREEAQRIGVARGQQALGHLKNGEYQGDINLPSLRKDAVPELSQIFGEHFGGTLPTELPTINEDRARQMADAYDKLPTNDPTAKPAYDALNAKVAEQKQALEAAGYRFQFVDKDPYNNSAEMLQDVRENRTLKVLRTNPESAHPYMTPEQNDAFRAVHDMTHAAGGLPFGPRGEEAAAQLHASTMDPLAQRALLTETRGQNSWVNYGPNADLPVGERPFAPQKAALWPEEHMGPGGTFGPGYRDPSAVMARLRPYEYPNHDFRTPAEKVLQPREPDPALLEAHGIPAPGPSMPGQQRALPSQAQDVQAELGYNHEPMPMERVLQAAVRDFNRGKPGATFAAPTHAEAIDQAVAAGLSSRTLSRAYGISDANRIGFVTSTGRFVNRSEAYQLADRAQQLSETAEPTYGLLHNQLASRDPFARFPTPGAIWGGKMPAGPTPASTLPADELTPTSWALAHFTQGTRSQARWLNNIRSVNPALSQALEAQPDLAKKLYSRATEHRAFVNGMPSTEQAIADARGPAGDPLANWYRGWMPTLKAAGIPDKTAKMLTDFRSILSAQASPESEMDMSLRAWDAAEHGEKITPGLLGNSGARTEKVRLAAQGEPWAEQTGILPVEPKTAPYNLANRGFTQTGAVDRHMMKYYTGTAEGLTPAQKQILQARMTHDAHVAGMGVDEFQARIWGHQTGYGLGKGRAVGGAGGIAEGSEGVAAQPPEYWLKQHLASGRFDRLLTKYPGLQALAEEGAMQGEETPGSGLFEH